MTLDTLLAPAVAANDWVAIAATLSVEFKATAAEQESRNELPVAELALFRETGLVNLLIPEKFGGAGGNWKQAVRVIAELAKADPNIGLLVAYHYHNYQAPWLDYVGGAETIQRRSAENRWLWGHVQRLTFAHPGPDGGFILRGFKPMNTGAATGDVMSVLAQRSDRDECIYAVVPTDRKGVIFHNDWDHLGLRRTNTTGLTFEDVAVSPDEVIPNADGPLVELNPWFITNRGIAFGGAYLGAALGVLDAAKTYFDTRTVAHAAHGGGLAVAEAPFILAEVGKLWARAQAALAYLDQIAAAYDDAFARDPSPRNEDLGSLRADGLAFQAVAAALGIDAGAKVYDILGGGATANRWGFDRYWRDVRTHSLEGAAPPYAERMVGDFYVNGDSSPRIHLASRRLPLFPPREPGEQ